MKTAACIILALTALSGIAFAGETVIPMHLLTPEGTGKAIGTVTVADSQYGLIFAPSLSSLSPGLHGVHVHQNPDCGPAAKDGKTVPGLAAGGHYDPENAGSHQGPVGRGHLGDLPALYVAADGTATLPVIAPRLSVKALKGRSVIIHAGGDNYSDEPEKLGGGGARVACGIVP